MPVPKQRLSPREYAALCVDHFRTYWKRYTAPLVVLVVLPMFVRVDVNYTASLPDHVFVTVKGWKDGLSYGDYVAYRFPTENPASPFRKGDHMVKIVVGMEGDEVRIDADRNVTVVRADEQRAIATLAMGGFLVGKSKSVSRAGKKLESIQSGTVPAGTVFVYAPHTDSLDSRYEMVGYIPAADVIGRSFPIF